LSVDILGAIIAGGRSTRFGAPKALAMVAGQRIIDRVAASLESVTTDIVVIANDDTIAAALTWPSRPDVVADAGALGGLLTGLLWAQERGLSGIIAVACDMPFVPPSLLETLRDRARRSPAPDVVVPCSNGPRGIEPLCAFYSVSCLAPIHAAIDRDDARMIGFHRDVRVDRIPIDEVTAIVDPDTAFMNVNTREDVERAEELARAIHG
jgi:molybdopterin-guanine dinucleotide biosynthesis protein A